jgi:hypothetical protein
MRFDLPPRGTLTPNDDVDPLPYYYNPWVGWLYRHRLQMGLDLLPAGGRRILEIGVGSGILVPTLTKHYPEYTGTDLTLAAPNSAAPISYGMMTSRRTTTTPSSASPCSSTSPTPRARRAPWPAPSGPAARS